MIMMMTVLAHHKQLDRDDIRGDDNDDDDPDDDCVSLTLDMGDISRSPGPHIFPLFSPGSPSPLFSWVNHTPTLRQPKQARRVKQLCWWVVLSVFQWSCVEGRLPPVEGLPHLI